MKASRMICSDIKRLFVSKNFYFAIAAVMVLCFLSVLGEIDTASDVYYLVELRHGIGAFLMAMSVLAALPFGLSFREDCENNYIHGIRGRIGCRSYCFSKVLTTAVGTFLMVFLGYALFFGFLCCFYPAISERTREAIRYAYENGGANPDQMYIANGKSLLYFVHVFMTEAAGYGFMAVFTLMVSAKVKNVFVLLSMPVILYYGWIAFCDVAYLPGIFRWYWIMTNGGVIRRMIQEATLSLLAILGYFGVLTVFCGVIFYRLVRREELYG